MLHYTITDIQAIDPVQYDWGAVKWVCNGEVAPGCEQSFGLVHILGEMASELIHQGQLVLHEGGAIDRFIHMTFCVPSRSEAYKYAAYDGLTRLARRRETPQSISRNLNPSAVNSRAEGRKSLPNSAGRPQDTLGMEQARRLHPPVAGQ